MANCSPSEGNAGTVEKGSGTVKIVATTMTQVAHKEGKRWGMEEGKDRGAARIVQEPTASTSQLGQIATGPASSPWRRPAKQ
jgi:hypothetical protein